MDIHITVMKISLNV